MKILITNDDGVNAQGIFEVARLLQDKHEVYIVAPDTQKSGASQSISIRGALFLNEVNITGLEKCSVWSVTGSPADCVKMATGAMKIRPDLIISGMNMGANLGTDVMYSGTIGAALEAALLGYPCLALSVCSHHPSYIEDAAHACMKAFDFYMNNLNSCKILSVNVPDIPLSEIKGQVVTYLCKRHYPTAHVLGEDGAYHMPEWTMSDESKNYDCDEGYIQKGYVTWTPLMTEVCDTENVEKIRKIADI